MLLAIPLASAQDLQFGYVPAPKGNENPALLVTPGRPTSNLHVECVVAGKTYTYDKKGVGAGTQAKFEWPRNTAVTHADCFVRANFSDGNVEEINVPVVLPREEVAARISLLGAPAQLVAKLLRQRAAHYESQLVGHNDVATTMISTHLLQQGGRGISSPLDDLGA